MQLTGLHRNVVDQFYTRQEVAHHCVDLLRQHVDGAPIWVEPSAGTGVFLDIVPGAIGYDIDPKHPRAEQANFLEVDVPQDAVVYGNPPFGRQASLAKAFIAHASRAASIIAFILPRSFMKPSMQKVFPKEFHLVKSEELGSNSFVVNGEPYHVPCVFQVWKRMDVPRPVEDEPEPEGFAFVKSGDPHDMVFRRVGGNAGRCSTPGEHSPQTHYYIKFMNPAVAEHVIHESQEHTFPTNTTGPRSISKAEATRFLNTAIANA
jgi:predicted RNA methylase